MSFFRQRAELERAFGNWSPAHRLLLLCGPDESGTADLARRAMAAFADADDPMAVTDLDGRTLAAEPGRLADEAAAISMFGGRRLIRVRPAGDEVTAAADLLLKQTTAGNMVLLVAGELRPASSLRKLVDGSAAAVGFVSYALDARSAGQWLEGEAQARGLRFGRDVRERLLALAGGDLGILASELDKFALFLGAAPGQPAELLPEHLAQLGADSGEEDVNQLVLTLVMGNRRAIDRQLQLLGGSSAIPVLRALARRLLQLADIRAMIDAGRAPRDAVAAVRPPVFWKEREALTRVMADWPTARIRAGLAACLDGERAIKASGGPGDIAGWQALLALVASRPTASQYRP